MRQRCDQSCCFSNLKFFEKLYYLLDSWMFTMLPAPNWLIIEQAIKIYYWTSATSERGCLQVPLLWRHRLTANHRLTATVTSLQCCINNTRWMSNLAPIVVYIEFAWNYASFNSNYYFMKTTHVLKPQCYAHTLQKSLPWFVPRNCHGPYHGNSSMNPNSLHSPDLVNTRHSSIYIYISMEFLFFHQMYIFRDLWHILMAKGWSVTSWQFFELIHFPINLNSVSNEHNLNEIKFHKHFSWDSPLGIGNNGDYFFMLLFCHCHFLLLTWSHRLWPYI